jgi:hypothetical protein
MRYEAVASDAGNVRGYSHGSGTGHGMNPVIDANAFNARAMSAPTTTGT